MKNLSMLKTIYNKGIGTLFLPLSQNQYRRHPTHSLDHVTYDCNEILTETRCDALNYKGLLFKQLNTLPGDYGLLIY